jgi:spore germination protein
VVIVVALTAIASFAIPNEEFSSTFRLLKFLMIFLGALWGLYGIMLGVLVLLIHLASMESFGIPYFMPAVAGTVDRGVEYQDFVMRKPIFTMRERPIYTQMGQRRRFRKCDDKR